MSKVAVRMGESPDPPFGTTYKNLFDAMRERESAELPVLEERELPLVDLKQLSLGVVEREACRKLIGGASREWGFFQVINHGISREILETMRAEQVKALKKPFHEKKTYEGLHFSAGSYRWGTPSATCLKQLSWSEAFHVQLNDILASACTNSLSSSMKQFASAVSEVAHQIADILAEEIGRETGLFKERCLPSSCYLRLNRYPPCPTYNQMLGLMPHTDSDFLTVLHQDTVGGLQLVKDGTWFAVKPTPDALIINIGDLFQAWSNNVYKSVEHRVVVNAKKERFSTAYFFCPSSDTIIESGAVESAVYRSFSFREFQKQVAEDVHIFGRKIGLPRSICEQHRVVFQIIRPRTKEADPTPNSRPNGIGYSTFDYYMFRCLPITVAPDALVFGPCRPALQIRLCRDPILQRSPNMNLYTSKFLPTIPLLRILLEKIF